MILDTAFTTDPVQAHSKAWLPTGPGKVKIQAGWEPANARLGGPVGVGAGGGPEADVRASPSYDPNWQQTYGNELAPNQFDSSLSTSEAYAACGPAAAVAFARTYGRNPTMREAVGLAAQVGWTADAGMAGPSSEIALLQKMGVPARLQWGPDVNEIIQDVNNGHPVILDTSGHYFVVDGYNAETGQFHTGNTGSPALRSGGKWMTWGQINGAGMGQVRAAIFLQNPEARTPSVATQAPSPQSTGDAVVSQPPRPRMDTMQGAGDQPPSATAGQPQYGTHRDDSYGGYDRPASSPSMTAMGGTNSTYVPPAPSESPGVPPNPMNTPRPSTPGPTYAGGLAGGESAASAPTAGQPVTAAPASTSSAGRSPETMSPPPSGPGVSSGARPETFGRPAPSSQGAPVAPGVAPAPQPPAPTDVNSSIHGWGMSPLEVPSHQVLPGDWNQPGANWSQPGNPNTSPWVNTTYGTPANFPPSTGLPPGEHFTGSSPSDPSGYWTTSPTPAAPGVAAGSGDVARGQGLLHGQPVPTPGQTPPTAAPAATAPPDMSGQVWMVDGQPSTDYRNPGGYWTNPAWSAAADAATTQVGGGQAVGRGAAGPPPPQGAQANMSHVPGWPRIPNNPSWPPPWPAPWPARWPQPNLGASSTPYQAQSQGQNLAQMPSVGPTTSQSALRGSSS